CGASRGPLGRPLRACASRLARGPPSFGFASRAALTGLPSALRASGPMRPRGGPSGSCELLSLLDRLHRARPLAQHEFLDLARRRLRQLAEHDALRHLEAREVAPAVLDQLLRGDGGAGLELDERAWRLAPA